MQGSGIILFLLVGLWALALVPALLRRHDGVADSRAIEHFAQAMRVLSRSTPSTVSSATLAATRPAPAAADRPARSSGQGSASARPVQARVAAGPRPTGAARAAGPARPGPAVPTVDVRRAVHAVTAALAAVLHGLVTGLAAATGLMVTVVAGLARLLRRLAAWRPARRHRMPAPARGTRPRNGRRHRSATRRRRTLLLLVMGEVALVLAAVAVGGVLWGPVSFVGVLLVAFVGHLRAEGRRAAQSRRRREAARRRAQATAPAAAPSRPAPTPRPTWRSAARGDVRPAAPHRPTVAVESVSEQRYADPRDRRTTAILDEPLPPRASDDARPAGDGTWHPVDVPLPTYVTKAAAPQRPAERVRPGHWSDGLSGEPGIDPASLDRHGRLLDRPRAVGD